MNKDAPCHGCDVRFLGCQSVCFKYEEWKLTRAQQKQQEKREKILRKRRLKLQKSALRRRNK